MLHTILAQQAAGGLNPVVLILIMIVFFFFMMWPQMRKQKKAKAYLTEIKKGDHVVTTGGVHGKVTTVGDTYFMLELEEGKMKVEKGSISMDMTMAAYKPASPEAKA